MEQQIELATNQKAVLAKYIAGGGLKPVIGEWALAGDPARGDQHVRAQAPCALNHPLYPLEALAS